MALFAAVASETAAPATLAIPVACLAAVADAMSALSAEETTVRVIK